MLSSVFYCENLNLPRRRKTTLSISPHLLQSCDIATRVLTCLYCHLGVAYVVRALAPVRIFYTALRNLLRLLPTFRASDFLLFNLRLSTTEYSFPSVSLRPAPFMPMSQREGGNSPDTPRPSPSRLDCLLT